MRPAGGLPTYLNPEIGYALWWLTGHSGTPASGPDVIERLMARGIVRSRDEARAVLQRAQANMAARERVASSTDRSALAAACGYRCDPATPIALRIRMDARDANGNVVESRSIVINARASDNLRYVLDRAREAFNRRFNRGTRHVSGQLRIEQPLTTADIDQVLLNYTEGSVWA